MNSPELPAASVFQAKSDWFFCAGFSGAVFAMLACVYAGNLWLEHHSYDLDSASSGDWASPPSLPDRAHKAQQILQLRPDTLILGTSRLGIGLASHDLPSPQRAYNLSLVGGTAFEIYRYGKYAIDQFPVREAYIGMDFESYAAPGMETAEFSSFRLPAFPVPGRLAPIWSEIDTLLTRLSAGRLLSARRMLLGETLRIRPSIDQRGNTDYPDALALSEIRGNGRAIGNYELTTATYLSEHWSRAKQDPEFPIRQIEWTRQLADLFQARGVTAHFFFTPSHAYHWSAMRRAGVLTHYFHWQTALLDALAAGSPGQTSGPPVHSFVMAFAEDSSAVGDFPGTASARGYLDASHFTPAIGQDILTAITMQDSRTVVTPDGLPAHQKRIETSISDWVAEHSTERESIEKLVRAATH